VAFATSATWLIRHWAVPLATCVGPATSMHYGTTTRSFSYTLRHLANVTGGTQLCGYDYRGGSRGETRVTSHPPPDWRGSLFHVIIMRVTSVD